MRHFRALFFAIGFAGLTLGGLAFSGGCGGGSENQTGTQVQVNQKQEQENQDKMREFMAKKAESKSGKH